MKSRAMTTIHLCGKDASTFGRHTAHPLGGSMSLDFSAAYARIREATGLQTQTAIADFLGIRQSSISDAKRRCTIPDTWLIALLQQKSINPTWITTGTGSRYLAPAETCPEERNLHARLSSPELEQRIRAALTDISIVEALVGTVRAMTGTSVIAGAQHET